MVVVLARRVAVRKNDGVPVVVKLTYFINYIINIIYMEKGFLLKKKTTGVSLMSFRHSLNYTISSKTN